VDRHAVVVVGAGPAGLGAAARLRRAGFDPVVLERAEQLAAAWRTRYDSFRLHTVRWLSALPGIPIPAQYGAWVTRDDFVAYLDSYARRFGIEPRFGIELMSLTRWADDGPATRWCLGTSAGPIAASTVVLATGACNRPIVPSWPGRSGFVPPLVHSCEYRNCERYRGGYVLVVGSGNSATEIATDLATASDVRVDLAVRTPPSIVRRDTRGIPTQLVGIALRHAPAFVVDPLAVALRRLTIGDLSGYGLPAPAKPYSQFLATGTLPVLDHGFIAAVRAGRIGVLRGVSTLDGAEVVHDDGTRSRPDAVIAATGYQAGLEPILGPLALLDDRGLPTVSARGVTDPVVDAPGLFTVGISIQLSGLLREIAADSRRLVGAMTAAGRNGA
jgi:cation diffusion facilitator CzcD-associated flavoprotein CzcO